MKMTHTSDVGSFNKQAVLPIAASLSTRPPSFSFLFLSISFLHSLRRPLYPAMLPLVSPPPDRPVAANRRVLSSPPIRGMRLPLRDGDASLLPEWLCVPGFPSPSISLCINERRHQGCWHDKVTRELSPKLLPDRDTGTGRYWK